LLGPAKSVFARAKTLVNPIEVEDVDLPLNKDHPKYEGWQKKGE
jgi:hypothetical protein